MNDTTRYTMKTLDDLAFKYQTDKGTRQITTSSLSPKGYTIYYEHYFEGLREKEFTLFEIGIANGGSLLMWEEYFPKAKIVGIDINPKTAFKTNRIVSAIGSQSDAPFLDAVVKEHGRPTIIIDDGGHKRRQQIDSFYCLWPDLAPGGFYAIEDLSADPIVPQRDPLVQEIITLMFPNKDWFAHTEISTIHISPRLIIIKKRKHN